MKKIITTTVLLFSFVFALKAQVSKGTVFIGTTIGTTTYSSAADNLDYTSGSNINKNTDSKSFGFSVGPQVGIFLSNHFVLGGTLTYNITTKTTDAVTNSSINLPVTAHTQATNYTANIGPFMRYYFFNQPAKTMFYWQANATAGIGNGSSSGNGVNVNSTYTTDGKVSNIFNWNAGSSIGITHFFTNSVGMDIALGYTYTSASSGNVTGTSTTNKTNNNIALTSNNYNETTKTNGISLGVGFHWYLPSKKNKL